MIKDSLLEHIIATCVETASAGRLILATSTGRRIPSDEQMRRRRRRRRSACSAASWPAMPRPSTRHWPAFIKWLSAQELLYVPLGQRRHGPAASSGPGRIGQLLDDLLSWLPRLGLIRETCQLLDVAQAMEAEHPVGPGAVTEYDRLFTERVPGDRAGTRRLGRELGRRATSRNAARFQTSRPSDAMLVEALQDLTESQLNRWLTHSHTLRLSVVERLPTESEWHGVRRVRRTLRGRSVHAEVPQPGQPPRDSASARAASGLSNSEQARGSARIFASLPSSGKHISARRSRQVAHDRDRSDRRKLSRVPRLQHDDDPLRPRRAAVHAHRFPPPAGRLRSRRLELPARRHGPRNPRAPQPARRPPRCGNKRSPTAPPKPPTPTSPASRNCATNTASACRASPNGWANDSPARWRSTACGPWSARRSPPPTPATTRPFAALEQEIASLAQEPAGAGLDLPDWLAALEEEVSMVRCRRRQPVDRRRPAPHRTGPAHLGRMATPNRRRCEPNSAALSAATFASCDMDPPGPASAPYARLFRKSRSVSRSEPAIVPATTDCTAIAPIWKGNPHVRHG